MDAIDTSRIKFQAVTGQHTLPKPTKITVTDTGPMGLRGDSTTLVPNAMRRDAATKIQAAWRGRVARAVVENMKYRPGGPGFQAARNDWAARGGDYRARARAILNSGVKMQAATRQKFERLAAANTFTEADKQSIRGQERRLAK